MRVVCDVKRVRAVRKRDRIVASRAHRRLILGCRTGSRVGNFDRRARKVGRYVAAYGVKVGYLVRERYLCGRVYLVSINVRVAVYRARKRGAVCEYFDYFVFLRRDGYNDRIAQIRLAVGYARNGADSVRVVPYARIHDGGNRRVDIGLFGRERVIGEGNLSRNVTATKQSHLRFAYRG